MKRSGRIRRILIATAVLACLAMPAFLLVRRISPPRPVVHIPEDTRRIVAPQEAGKVKARYEIVNRGRRDLVLGEPHTSCGCTVAQISPRRVRPGARAEVVVEASPPRVGETEVSVQIPTNTEPPRPVLLKLVLVGTARVPYVASHEPAVSFGTVEAAGATAVIRVETREQASRPPWFVSVASSLPFVKIRGDKPQEIPLGADIVLRKYLYTAELTVSPPAGEFAGDVMFHVADKGSAEFKMPMYGIVAPAVAIAPKALYAEVDRGQLPPTQSITLRAHGLKGDFTAEVQGSGTLPAAVIPSGRGPGWIRFDVTPKSVATRSFEGAVQFRTNHPLSPVASVPLSYRVVGGD